MTKGMRTSAEVVAAVEVRGGARSHQRRALQQNGVNTFGVWPWQKRKQSVTSLSKQSRQAVIK